MWFGRKAKIRKAVERALAGVEADDDLADHAPIEALPEPLQLQAYYTLVLALHDDELYAAARHTLARALALAPENAELQRLAAMLASELGDVDDAIEAQRRVVAASPRDMTAVATLADLLIISERIEEAIALLRPLHSEQDPTLDTKLAEALFVHGDNEEALAILDAVCALYDAQLKHVFGPEWQTIKARADEADRLRNDVYAEMHGREATIELAAAAGKLDASAGVNYRLLGARLAATSE